MPADSLFSLVNYSTLAPTGIQLAVGGTYVRGDAIHVGLYWNTANERRIVHFQDGKDIPVEFASEAGFGTWLFAEVTNFKIEFIDSLAALAELVSENRLDGLKFKRKGTYYDGGKFEYKTGAFTGKTEPEKFINCGVFVFALLRMYDCTLLDWPSWPDADEADRTFLEDWLNEQRVPITGRDAYYHKTKIVRGKHVLASPLTPTQPSPYIENEPLATAVVKRFQEMV